MKGGHFSSSMTIPTAKRNQKGKILKSKLKKKMHYNSTNSKLYISLSMLIAYSGRFSSFEINNQASNLGSHKKRPKGSKAEL
jgi:hypothetical protein